MKEQLLDKITLFINFLKQIDCVFVRFGFATKTIGEHGSTLH